MMVSLLCVDSIIKVVFNLLWYYVKELIEGVKVWLNWVDLLKVDYELVLLDMLSVNYYGCV